MPIDQIPYKFEQQSRRPIVILAVIVGIGMVALGLANGAPWFFTAIPALSTIMALVIFVQNSHSGLRLESNTLTLFKGQWRHEIDMNTIRRMRTTLSMQGQPSVWLDFHNQPSYRLPGYCFGSAEPLKDAFRKRGIAVD